MQEISEQTILALIAELQKAGLAAWTIRGVLTPLGRILASAVRRGLIPSNPMLRLERGERPSVNGPTQRRILSSEEIRALLDAALPTYRALLATAVYTGLRLGELLGLTWADVDFDGGFVRVRGQADRRSRERVEPKTPRAVRDVPLLPALGKLLREHKAASAFSRAADPVFASGSGRPLHYRNVSARGVEKAAGRAGLNREHEPPVTMHTLRRTFASHLILDLGLDPVQVSRLLGHSRPSITADVYADLFDQARHADDIRQRMAESAFGNALETPARTARHSGQAQAGGEVVDLRGDRT